MDCVVSDTRTLDRGFGIWGSGLVEGKRARKDLSLVSSGCGELRACLPVSAQPSLLYFYLLTQAALFRRLPSGYSESHSNFTGRHADQGGQLPVVPLEIGVTSLSWFARKLPGFSTENPASWESIVPGQTGLLAPRIGPRLPVGPGTAALKGSSSLANAVASLWGHGVELSLLVQQSRWEGGWVERLGSRPWQLAPAELTHTRWLPRKVGTERFPKAFPKK